MGRKDKTVETNGMVSRVMSPVLLLFVIGMVAGDGWNWDGRATFYGDDPRWPIHEGSCGRGNIPHEKWGNVAATNVFGGGFGPNPKCGQCYEVQCYDGPTRGGNGAALKEKGCKDYNRIVKVEIIDSCPCDKPDNYHSNKRWCCGDKFHIDLSYWAFEKIAHPHRGVVDLKYRQVSC